MTTRFRSIFNPSLGEDEEMALPPAPADVLDFHRSLPEYKPTPLYSLPGLAEELGIGQILIKDESQRFGLKSFKALGATYAIHRLLKQLGGENPAPGSLTFTTASDGNFGRAVAWTARRLKQKAVIYMPKHSAKARIKAIEGEGAKVVIKDADYDGAVKRSDLDAGTNGWHIISHTSYADHFEVPSWVMAGYSTLFQEVDQELREQTLPRPDTVFLQGGVGCMAYAAAGHYGSGDYEDGPRLAIVEPIEADCLLESAASKNGEIRFTKGKLNSLMGGLNCGTPSLLAWPTLRNEIDYFLAIDDIFAEEAMRRLYDPPSGDPRIVAGESGAAGMAGLFALCRNPELEEDKDELELNEESTVLLINTEGDTDPVNFEKVVGETARA